MLVKKVFSGCFGEIDGLEGGGMFTECLVRVF